MFLDRLVRRLCCDRIEIVALIVLGIVLIVAVVVQNTVAPLPLEGNGETFCAALRRVEVVYDIDDDICCVSFGQIASYTSEKIRFIRDGYYERLYNYKPLTADSLYVELGPSQGDVTEAFHDKFRPQMLLLEPSPKRFDKRRSKYDIYPNVELRNVAIGQRDANAFFVETTQGAHVIESYASNAHPIRIETWATALEKRPNVDLLFLNCEGCEYVALTALTNSTVVSNVQTIMVQFHKQFEDDASRKRCAIRKQLRKTHKLVYQVTWVWEIWEIRQ